MAGFVVSSFPFLAQEPKCDLVLLVFLGIRCMVSYALVGYSEHFFSIKNIGFISKLIPSFSQLIYNS